MWQGQEGKMAKEEMRKEGLQMVGLGCMCRNDGMPELELEWSENVSNLEWYGTMTMRRLHGYDDEKTA